MSIARDLTGKTVLITGGSSGIGHAMALALAGAGARIAIVSRRTPADWPAPPPAGWNAERDLVLADLADTGASLTALENWLNRNSGGLHGLITSAIDYASPSRHGLGETSLAEWDRLFDVNARGTFLAIRAVLPHLLANGAGLVAGVTSDVAFTPAPFRTGYAASKAAARALFDGLAAELEGTGINAVQLLPAGQVATSGLARRRPQGFDWSGYLRSAAFAEPICTLVRHLGSGMNGQVITVGSQDA